MNRLTWLPGVAMILVSIVLGVLSHKCKPSVESTPKVFDSTAYYKTLYQQSQLYKDLDKSTIDYEHRLQKIEQDHDAEHRRIDSLRGDGLQREMDRNYNSPPARQPQTHRTQTDPPNRSRGADGSQGTRRPDNTPPGGQRQGYVIVRAEPGHCCPAVYDHEPEPATAGFAQQWTGTERTGRPLPQEVARSQVGKLDRSGRSPALRSRQTQTNLRYWRLIQAQNYTYPDVAFAISAVETGYWPVRRRGTHPGNNLFGMKKNSRNYYSSLTAGGYCRYSDENASLADYGAYEQQVIRRYGLHSRSAYLAHIRNRYCPNRTYRSRLDLAFQKLADLRLITYE